MALDRSVLLRDVRRDELDEVAQIMLAAYRQYAPGPDADDDLRKAFDEYFVEIEDVHSRLDASVLIVAEHDGRIVGAVTYYPPTSSSGEGFPQGWASFRLLAVHPDARGLGVGRLLTDECLRRARDEGAPTMGIHTTHVMAVARDMYERIGFTRAPEYDFHPTPDFTVVAYRLEL